MVRKALTIAGSDSGGGAGIQADIKTFQELNVFGTTAITAITAQNTLGVQGIHPVPVPFVIEQVNSVLSDIKPDAIKLGMLFTAEIIEGVANVLTAYVNPIVADPVMIAKGGSPLLKVEAIDAYIQHILPITTVLTPNIPEAETLTGIVIHSMKDQEKAAKQLVEMGANSVVVKGGHFEEDLCIDVLYHDNKFSYYQAPRHKTKHTHGTGCTFAAAIAASMAQGESIPMAVQVAKAFIQAAITNELGIGDGHGPTNHWAYRGGKWNES